MQQTEFVIFPWLSKCHIIHLRWRVAANLQIRWGRDCVYSCRLRLWQYAKNFKSTLKTEGTRMSLTSFVRLLYISITPLCLNFYPISVTTSSEEGGRKKKEERCKNKLCVYKNLQSDESGEETRAPARARLCAACWHCVTLALMVFHVEGCNAALSSWGDKAPAVTHHQQRNKIAKRWTQKEQGKNGVVGGGRAARSWLPHEYSNWQRYLCDDY